jgi:hypothetical protein
MSSPIIKRIETAGAVASVTVFVLAAVLEAGKELGGQYLAYAALGVAAIVAFVAAFVLSVQRWPSAASGRASEVMSGPVQIPPQVPRVERRVRLESGEVIFGSLTETRGASFGAHVRSAAEEKRHNAGKVSVTIGDFEGNSTSYWQTHIPAPTAGWYHIEFKQLGDQAGREIQVRLQKKPTDQSNA